MQKIVQIRDKKEVDKYEKLREFYKNDFLAYVKKRDSEEKTIQFRNYDFRERM